MKFYRVSDRYIAYLKSIDPLVLDNYSGKRPYVGIILQVSGHQYLAPLTSHKEKHDSYKSSNPTIYKLHEKGNENNKLGMINLNNMIPVIESEVTEIDFSREDKKYRNLLSAQLAYIKSNQDSIVAKAAKLHNLVTAATNFRLRNICCNFSALEENYRNFNGYAAVGPNP